MKVLISAFLLAIPLLAVAQQTSGQQTSGNQTSTEEQVRRVFSYTQAYRKRLPSLECDETMLSQRIRNGKVRREVKIEATLREL
jgi:hypothetical protein